MDIKQLLTDIFTFNFKSMHLRLLRLQGLLNRKLRGPTFSSVIPEQIPIIINNRNRHTYLLQLITWLENAGMKRIIILDNDSTYPPLLNYYAKTKHRVVKLGANVGHLALWKSKLYDEIKAGYYVYTDPDVVPADCCPKEVLQFLLQKLEQYPQPEKIGLGLRIDDLPDYYESKLKVIEWESRFWTKQVDEIIFDAGVDTTFALYRPFTNGAEWVSPAYRSGLPYVAHHLPWYENSADPGEENLYYAKHVRQGASHWIEKK
jgi:hypothetical protein